ncbi:proline-rich protein 5a isoform X1 [Phyllopteryx taeniolatus]|uniref:proline-rich protein 5a isoform X1 n=1 Tax=Phyllopteryx taeniolatus TaxID=161469 RepID=UPI002AD42DE0|nr:proline-rich protein 5a isoform X1 [Phyllopteryx taeniolatus]XP_061628971.1 proline-rich protein 5a isoform X1 [Phyllopteryx taeniolatus]XP_061628972.1 proline-rich protein 5a isoform X1 [Phyllopteryx taeniolatus]XP_061628973.1 proline-rich protein 5a isoform X1 [Phyllopteryx taeniolatus]
MLDGLRRRHASRSSPRPLSLNFSTFSAPPPPSPDLDGGGEHPIRRTLHRLKLMSSPSLSELAKSDKGSPEDRGEKQKRAGANATWNSIHNAVIAVFQKKGLADNELYVLNEGVRHLLKTELGSFFSEYLQNQLLTKGMVILRDKIRFYEGQKLLDSLAETWDFFFCDVLPMVQAIFHPVQGKEPSVRQLALLHFRSTIVLSVKLEDALSRPRARVPPSVTQMLLVLQGVHESRGVNEDYLRLEALVQKVVSPYLGTHGLHSGDHTEDHCCVLEKRFQWGWSKSAEQLSKNPVVRSKSYNIPLLLTPVAEYDADCGSVGSGGIRRHSACEMISCLEEQKLNYAELAAGSELSGSASNRLCVGSHFKGMMQAGAASTDLPLSSPSILHSSGALHGTEVAAAAVVSHLGKAAAAAAAACSPPSDSSSPETIIGQVLQSADSDSDGIFIDFSRSHSPEALGYGRESRQSTV